MTPSKYTQLMERNHDAICRDKYAVAANVHMIVAAANYGIALQLSRIADALEQMVPPTITTSKEFITEFKVPNAVGVDHIHQHGIGEEGNCSHCGGADTCSLEPGCVSPDNGDPGGVR